MAAASAQPIELPPGAGAAPPPAVLVPPAHGLFAGRALRLRQLAAGHSLRDFLQFTAALCDAQERVLDSPAAGRAIDVSTGGVPERLTLRRIPLLPAATTPRGEGWPNLLFELIGTLRDAAPQAVLPVLDGLNRARAVDLEGLADAVVSGQWQHPERDRLLLVSAALQVVWTGVAARLTLDGVEFEHMPNLCPVCGSQPVASVIRAAGSESGLRYLHCALCNTEWHFVRAECSQCRTSKGHAYVGLECGGVPAVVGEICDGCHSYLKLLRLDKDPELDPVADDLASLALDILLDEQGYARSGPNPLLIPAPA